MSDFLRFEVDGRCHSIRADRVREVAPLGPLTPVPTAQGLIAGVTQVRGHILPVLDLEPAEVDASALRRLLLVVEEEGIRAAIRVDRVLGVQTDDLPAPDVDLGDLYRKVRDT